MTATLRSPIHAENPLCDERTRFDRRAMSDDTVCFERLVALEFDDATDRSTPPGRSRRGPATRRENEDVYLRRRVVLGFAVAAVLVAVVVLLASAMPARADNPGIVPAVAGERTTYLVQPGDTLWSIAETLAPDSDRREVVDALAEVSGGAALQPGQRLYLPGSLTRRG